MITGLPGSPPAILEDASLPHQIVLYIHAQGRGGNKLGLSCTCLRWHGNGRGRWFIETRSGSFPAAEAIAAYRAWHADRGVTT